MRQNIDVQDLLKRYPLVSDQVDAREVAVVLRELERVLQAGVPGDVVEFGCYEGTTALFLQRLLRAHNGNRTLHVYDSFEGLPPKTGPDQSPAGEQFKAGELHAAKATLIKHFRHAGLPLPVIHKGWFSDIQPSELPEQITLAFLDGDFYESILDSLTLVWPRLSVGAVVLVDDYQSESLPGVRAALDEWAAGHQFQLRAEASLAIVTPVV